MSAVDVLPVANETSKNTTPQGGEEGARARLWPIRERGGEGRKVKEEVTKVFDINTGCKVR